MTTPRRMTQNTLSALKGWPSPYAVDFAATFDPSVFSPTRPYVSAGTVVRLNANGQYVLGVGRNRVMPLFLFTTSDAPDVSNPGGDVTADKDAFVGIGPTGKAMALVASGAYELVSTEFVTGQNYPPNTPLTSPDTGANAGRLQPGVLYTDMIVGIVSRGIVDNGHGRSAVAFWPFPVFPTT